MGLGGQKINSTRMASSSLEGNSSMLRRSRLRWIENYKGRESKPGS